jgi:flagellar basal body P-ring formation protein FlgA
MTRAAVPGFTLALVLAMTAPVQAQQALGGAAALDLIRQAMAQAGLAPPQMTAPKRALPPCATPPRVQPVTPDWSTAALICDAPQGWRRVLRTGAPALPPATGVATGATLGRAPDQATPDQPGTRPLGTGAPMVLVLARPLPQGARITADDLHLRPHTGGDPAQRLQDPALAIGRKLRRALGPGQVLLARHLDPARDIDPGQSVTLHLRHGAIDIATTATAMAGGVAGDRIPVQPASGGDPLEAMIIAPGLVQVRPNMPRRAAVRTGKRRLSWSE